LSVKETFGQGFFVVLITLLQQKFRQVVHDGRGVHAIIFFQRVPPEISGVPEKTPRKSRSMSWYKNKNNEHGNCADSRAEVEQGFWRKIWISLPYLIEYRLYDVVFRSDTGQQVLMTHVWVVEIDRFPIVRPLGN